MVHHGRNVDLTIMDAKSLRIGRRTIRSERRVALLLITLQYIRVWSSLETLRSAFNYLMVSLVFLLGGFKEAPGPGGFSKKPSCGLQCSCEYVIAY